MPDVLRSCVIIPLIYLYTIVMALLSLVLSFFDGDGRMQHWCAQAWCRMIAVTAGARTRVRGLENLPRDRACVVIANHQSYFDIPAIWANLPLQFRIMAKRVLFYIPFMGWFLWRAGHIPVDRENARAALANVRRAVDKLQAGYSIVVFPEGTRSKDGRLQDFKSGGFKIAMKAGVPVVPVTIIGTRRVLKKDSLIFHPGDVEVIIDPPIATTDYTNRTLPELVARTRGCIATHLAEADGGEWSVTGDRQAVGTGQ
ncbi:MAG TPA: lysophospholipid acyltransferase family protein [Blastocatellia bacterium]|nr:lysophospholipid acyltransferase family protein [Blastocatellia bacterium]